MLFKKNIVVELAPLTMLINENALLDSTVTVFIKVVTHTVTDPLANNLRSCIIVILIKALISVTNFEI